MHSSVEQNKDSEINPWVYDQLIHDKDAKNL